MGLKELAARRGGKSVKRARYELTNLGAWRGIFSNLQKLVEVCRRGLPQKLAQVIDKRVQNARVVTSVLTRAITLK